MEEQVRGGANRIGCRGRKKSRVFLSHLKNVSVCKYVIAIYVYIFFCEGKQGFLDSLLFVYLQLTQIMLYCVGKENNKVEII